MGLEIAGEIVEVGAKAGEWKIGDKVCALLGGGGYLPPRNFDCEYLRYELPLYARVGLGMAGG